MILAQGERSASLVWAPKTIFSPFSFSGSARFWCAKPEKREVVWWRFTPGGGLCGLARAIIRPLLRSSPERRQAPEFKNSHYYKVVEELFRAGAVVDWEWIDTR